MKLGYTFRTCGFSEDQREVELSLRFPYAKLLKSWADSLPSPWLKVSLFLKPGNPRREELNPWEKRRKKLTNNLIGFFKPNLITLPPKLFREELSS